MMNTKKRWLAALLSVVMVVAMLPSMAFAAVNAELPQPANLKVDSTTKTAVFDQVMIASTGEYKKAHTDYKVYVQKKLKTDYRDQWDAGDVEVTGEAKIKAVDNTNLMKVDFSAELASVNDKYDYRLSVAYTDKTDTSVAVTAPITIENKGTDVVAPTVYSFTQDAEGLATVTIKQTAEATDVQALAYDVVLYKNTVAPFDEKSVPSTAVKVDEKLNVAATGAETKVEFDASKFVFDKNEIESKALNTYFVVVTAKRAGYNSVVRTSKTAVINVRKPQNTFASLAVALETNAVATVSNVVAGTKVVAELRKNAPGTELVATLTETATDKTVKFDFSKLVKANGEYFVNVTASKYDYETKSAVSSSAKLGTLQKVANITAKIDKTGKLTVVADKTAADEVKHTSFNYVVLYKGNVVSGEMIKGDASVVNVEAGKEGKYNTAWGLKLNAGVPAVVVDKNSPKYNLADFSIRVYGVRPGLIDGDSVVALVEGTLKTPTNLRWENVAKAVNPVATWDAVEGATSYDVAVYKNDTLIGTVNVKGTSVNVATAELKDGDGKVVALTATDKLNFEVTAKAEGKVSEVAKSAKPDFVVNGVLAPAQNVKWNGNLATWTPVLGAESYTVKKIVNGKQVGPDCTTTTNSYQFKGLAKAGSYEFIVIANDADGAGYVSSLPAKSDVKYIAGATVGTPFITKASKTRTTVKLRWTAADNAQVYRIYYKTKGMDSYKMIVKSVRGDATAKTIKGLKKGTRYSFKVKAVNSGVAAYSNVKVVTTTK